MSARGYLLDTQILLLALGNPHDLPKRYRAILGGGEVPVVSAVSFWEIAIKKSIGRLKIKANYVQTILETETRILPITYVHAARIEQLPFHHRDPFDRMLVAQAQVENLTILATDRMIAAYDVLVI